MSHSFNIVYTV